MDAFTGFIGWLFSSWQLIGGGVGLWFLYQYITQRGNQTDIPPLDKFDAIKLEGLVSKQVEAALLPMLRSNGYGEEEIKSILTKTSLNKQTFKR
jgi:hypothetical protein